MPGQVVQTVDETQLAEHGLVNCARDEIRFVHGTTMDAELTNGVPIVPELGIGELGSGFYAFIASGENAMAGIAKAEKLARDRSGQRGGSRPCLVYVTIPTQVFLMLRKVEVTLLDAATYVTPRCRKGRSCPRGVPILWGPVFRDGLQIYWDQPRQYKFEAEACHHLSVVRCVQI